MDMAGLAFFDECTERIEDENGKGRNTLWYSNMSLNHYIHDVVPLLELDESQHSERTVFIPPPEAGANQSPIIYRTFKLNPDLIRPQKNFSIRNPNLSAFGIVPGSPMARRTKHEIKVAQRMARKQVRVL